MKKQILAFCFTLFAGIHSFAQVAPEPSYPNGGIATGASALAAGQSYCNSLDYVVPAGGTTTTDVIAIFENFDGSGLSFAENDNFTLNQTLTVSAGVGGNITLLAVNKAGIYSTLGLIANPLLCGNFVPDPDPNTTTNEACVALAAYYAGITGPGDITVNDLIGILASLGGAGVPTTTAGLITLLDAVEAGAQGLLVLDFSDTSLNVYVSQITAINAVPSACNNNGTPADPSDDFYTITVSPTLLAPASLGAGSFSPFFTIPTGMGHFDNANLGEYRGGPIGNYGTPFVSGNLLIADGTITVVIDDINSPCTAQVDVTPPAACSAGLDCNPNLAGVQSPGDACNDNNSTTTNDVYNANCVCAGTALPVDCLGVAGGSAVLGSACNDGNANTTNDVWGAGCVCAGTDPNAIPTASEWGLMCLGLSLMSLMVIFVRQREGVIA